MSLGPFDMTGGPFLTLYGLLLVMTVIAGIAIPRWLRPVGHGKTSDPQQLAWLSGGRTRFADTVVTRLLSGRALEMLGKDQFRSIDSRASRNPAEAAVLRLPPPIRWPQIDLTLKQYAEPVERMLVSAGLAMDQTTIWQMRLLQTLPYMLLFAFGATKYMIGTARDKPVGFLTLLLIATAIFALIRFFVVDRRTQAGIEAVQAAGRQSARLKQAPTNDEMDLAVALFGTAVLAGSGYAAFHMLRSPGGDSGSSSSGSSDSGGSGCGGGCGGCGG